MTKQKTFDKVVAHLRQQNSKSFLPELINNSKICAYRAPDGKMCAVGCLIPDELYTSSMEELNVTSPLMEVTMLSLGHDLELVRDLQCIHDEASVKNWEYFFKEVALDHGLVYVEKS